MSPYPQKPTFPVDLRPGRYSTVKRSGTSLVVDVDPTPLLAVDGPFGDEIEKRIPQLTRYGALPGSGDATVAFRSALASWMAGGERRVDVPGRNFTVSNGDGTANRGQYQACLLFQGTGTEEIAPHFRGTSLTMASGLPNSFATHVVVKNMKRFAPTGDLTLDWARLPFAQGVCVAVDGTTKSATFLLDLDTCKGIPTFTDVQRVSQHDPNTGRWFGTILEAPGDPSQPGRALTAVPVGDAAYSGLGTYRVDFSAAPDQAALSAMSVGASYALVANPFGNYGMYFENVDEVDLSGLRLRVYCAAGMGIGGNVNRVFIAPRSVSVKRPTGSKRFYSSCADGIHINGARDLVSIQARVSHTGDDGLNINIPVCFVYTKAAPGKPANTFLWGGVGGGRVPSVGDILDFQAPNGTVTSGGIVLAVDQTGSFGSTPAITMSVPFPPGFVGSNDAGSNFDLCYRVINLSDLGTLDIDPIVRYTRGAGIRVRGRGGRILGLWRDISGSAIFAALTLGHDNEGPNLADLTIAPSIVNAGYYAVGTYAAIVVTAGSKNGPAGPAGVNRRVFIGGDVRSCNVPAVYVQSTDRVTVGIKTDDCCLAPWNPGDPNYDPTAQIQLANSTNISLHGNESPLGVGKFRLFNCVGVRVGANSGFFDYKGPTPDPMIFPADLTVTAGGNSTGAGGGVGFRTLANPTFADMAQVRGHLEAVSGSEHQGGIGFHTRAPVVDGAAGQPLLERWNLSGAGHFLPTIAGAYNLGGAGQEIGSIYVVNIFFTGALRGAFPSSPSGLPAGTVWRDASAGGTLKAV